MKRKPIGGIVWALLALNGYAVLYVTFYLILREPEAQHILGMITLSLTAVFAAVAGWLAWRVAPPEERPTWAWLWGGAGLWAAAEIIWSWMSITMTGEFPVPSLADWLWFGGYACLLAGMGRFLYRLHFAWHWKNILIAVGGGMIIPVLIMLFFVLPGLEPGLTGFVNALYPAFDILLASAGFLILSFFSQRQKPWTPWHLIGIAQIIWAYADAWYWFLSALGHYIPYTTNIASTLMVDLPDMLASLMLGLGFLMAYRRFRVHDPLL